MKKDRSELIFMLIVSIATPILMIMAFNIGQETQKADQATVQR